MATFSIGELSNILALCESVVPKRANRPLLEHVLLRNGKVYATDLESWLVVDGDQPEDVECLLPADIRKLICTAKSEVTLETLSHGLRFVGNGSRIEVDTPDPQEYPDFGDVTPDPSFEVFADSLAAMIDTVLFAAERDGLRYNLGGVFLELRDGSLTVVASDGRRLCYVSRFCQGENLSLLLPVSAAERWRRVLGKLDDASVIVGLDGLKAVAKCGRIVLISSLLEAQFPRWRSILPSGEPVSTATVNRRDFQDVLERALIVLYRNEREGYRGRISVGDGRVVVRCERPYGRGEFTLPAETEGAAEVAFNLEFLHEFVKRATAATCVMRLFGATQPALFECDQVCYVLMPVVME